MDDEAETYKLWRIRKTVMQVNLLYSHFSHIHSSMQTDIVFFLVMP